MHPRANPRHASIHPPAPPHAFAPHPAPDRAPDAITPIQGWRVWDVVALEHPLRLCSLAFWSIWPPREQMQATCRRGRLPAAPTAPLRVGPANVPAPGGGRRPGVAGATGFAFEVLNLFLRKSLECAPTTGRR